MRWINVNTRLPGDRGWVKRCGVLAFDAKTGAMWVATQHPSWWNTRDERGPQYDGERVTHWMPLPLPPRQRGARR